MWNELTILWNDLTMERNDRLASCALNRLPIDQQIKIFVTGNTESDTFCMEEYSEKYTIASEIHCNVINRKGLHLNIDKQEQKYL